MAYRTGLAILIQANGGTLPDGLPTVDWAVPHAAGMGLAREVGAEYVGTFLGDRPLPGEDPPNDPGACVKAAGELLAWADMGGRDPAVWRAMARRVARVVGCGDMGRGCTRMLEDTDRHGLWLLLRQTVASVVQGAGDVRLPGHVDDLVHAFRRELACVSTEALLGLRCAAFLRPYRQEAVHHLPPAVRAAMRNLLAQRTRPLDGSNDFERLKAAAWAAVQNQNQPSQGQPENTRPGNVARSYQRSLDRIGQILDQANRLLRIHLIPLRVVLVPLELPSVPTEGAPCRAVGPGRSHPPPGPAPTEPPPAPEEGGPDPAQPCKDISVSARAALRWFSALRRRLARAIPHLTPALQDLLILPL